MTNFEKTPREIQPGETLSSHTGLSLHRLETDALHYTDERKRNQTNRFEFLWIRNGEGTISIDDRTYALDKDLMYVVTPGQKWHIRATHLNGFAICVCPHFMHLLHGQSELAFLSLFVPGHHVDPIPLQSKQVVNEFLDLVRLIGREMASTHSMRDESLKTMLMIFLIYFGHEVELSKKVTGAKKDEATVTHFLQLLKERISSMKQVNDYALALKVTPNYLNLVIKRFTGYNASQHIRQFIIMEAKRQVICSGLRMKEVADRLGFTDHAHFSKYFKTYTGVTFSHFRTSIAQGVIRS